MSTYFRIYVPGLSPQNFGKTPPCVSSYTEPAAAPNGASAAAAMAAAASVSL